MEGNETFLELNATQEIIVSLKAVQSKQNLSIPQIKKMVDATGTYLSPTTLRRVFAEGSEENDSFSYENTLRPIAQALLSNHSLYTEDEVILAKYEMYEAICRHKDEVIDGLRKQLESLREDHDARCKECEKRQDFLMNQIALKDKRIDERGEQIKIKDDVIYRLLDKVL